MEDTKHKPPTTRTGSRPATPAKWRPAGMSSNDIDRVVSAAKWALTFGALSCLFFYWQHTGLMDPAASIPCMCTCTALAGYGVGKNFKK